MIWAIAFSVAFAGFLMGCCLAALATEPRHDPLDESLLGDLPWVPGDLKSNVHARVSATKEQQRVV